MEAKTSEIVRREDGPQALARTEDWDLGVPVERLVARVAKIREVQSKVMIEGHHYGVIPGTGSKPTLLKPGAEILTLTFQLDPQFAPVDRWEGDHLETVVTCTLYHAPTGARVGSGIGSCSTKESKYAYRKGERVCPKCSKSTIIKGKAEYGGGWLCFAKKGGCGAKFGDKDDAIVSQSTDRVANPDLPDLYNTVRKMACKRAHVAAVLFVTCASEIFTQDIEDGAPDQGGGGWDDGPRGSTQGQQQQERGPATRSTGNANSGNGHGGGSSAEETAKLLKSIQDAATLEELEDLLPELNMLKSERVLSVDDYRRLRDAYGLRVKNFGSDTRASA